MKTPRLPSSLDQVGTVQAIVVWIRYLIVAGIAVGLVACVMLASAWLRLAAAGAADAERASTRDALRAELLAVSGRLANDQIELSGVQAKLAAATTELAENSAAYEALAEQRATAETAVKELLEQARELTKTRDGLQKKIDLVRDAESRLEGLKGSHESLLERHRLARAELALKQEELATLTAKLEQSKALVGDRQELAEELSGMRKERDMIMAERASLNKHVATLKEENQALATQYGQLKSSVLQAQRKLSEMFRYLNRDEEPKR